MKEVMRTENRASIAFIESVLAAESINYVVADQNYEGPGYARILVPDEEFEKAKELLISVGFRHEIYPLKRPSPE